jgi:hypothetical protein
MPVYFDTDLLVFTRTTDASDFPSEVIRILTWSSSPIPVTQLPLGCIILNKNVSFLNMNDLFKMTFLFSPDGSLGR